MEWIWIKLDVVGWNWGWKSGPWRPLPCTHRSMSTHADAVWTQGDGGSGMVSDSRPLGGGGGAGRSEASIPGASVSGKLQHYLKIVAHPYCITRLASSTTNVTNMKRQWNFSECWLDKHFVLSWGDSPALIQKPKSFYVWIEASQTRSV